MLETSPKSSIIARGQGGPKTKKSILKKLVKKAEKETPKETKAEKGIEEPMEGKGGPSLTGKYKNLSLCKQFITRINYKKWKTQKTKEKQKLMTNQI